MDLCKPSQRKFETAVSVVLGRNLEAIVVDEERTAIDCIEVRHLSFYLMFLLTSLQYMRNQRAGQATFIPLDTIQVKPINDKFRSFGKGIRLAVDLVQHEPVIERAIHHACGNALICDTMEAARYVCYDRGQEVKGKSPLLRKAKHLPGPGLAVTLEGTIIHKSGLITGGKSTHNNNKKWDEKYVQGKSNPCRRRTYPECMNL